MKFVIAMCCIPFCMLVLQACTKDECPVCPAPLPSTVDGTWEARFTTNDGHEKAVQWVLSQSDSAVTAIIQWTLFHGTMQTDTLSGALRYDGYLRVSASWGSEQFHESLIVSGLLNSSKSLWLGSMVLSATEMGQSYSFIQPFGADKE